MNGLFLSDYIPVDIIHEARNTLASYTGSQISITDDPPEEKGEVFTVPLMLNGQEAGVITAKNPLPDEKNAGMIEGIGKILSKMLYYRYLVLQRTENLEKNIRSQSEFMTRFADDVKNSVGEMFVYLADPSNEERDTEIKKNIDMLMARTLKLGNMVEGSIDYVEAINGVFELNEAVYSIRDVVENQISRNVENAAQKNDTLTYRISEEVPVRLMGDAGHIGTILGKLIEDSILYTENSFVDVEISAEQGTYGTTIVISVADGGKGIEPSKAEYIKSYMESRGFSNARNEEFDMLGFSLIGFCVNAMSGSIGLISEEGKGTRFEIRLPQLAVEGGTKDEF